MFHTLIGDNRPHKPAVYFVTSCLQSVFIEVRKSAENAASDGFVCIIKSNAERLQISRVKNIGNVFELIGVAFHLAPPYGGLLVCK